MNPEYFKIFQKIMNNSKLFQEIRAFQNIYNKFFINLKKKFFSLKIYISAILRVKKQLFNFLYGVNKKLSD